MPAHRSPNCPQITFIEASTRGRKVYDKEHTHPAPKAAVAEDLGYSGINGRALSIIGALRQYGILEGNSEALRVTEDAVAFYELEDGPERSEALHRMLFTPPFFESLRQHFGETLPSESTLKHHLIREGFLPKAADEVINVYRENLELVRSFPKRSQEDTSLVQETNRNTHQITLPIPQPLILNAPTSGNPILSFSFPLSLETKAELLIRGVVNDDDLEILRDQIELTIRALRRSQARGSSSHTEPIPQ